MDGPSLKSNLVNQWINKNGKCSKELPSKQTKQEVLQEQSIHNTNHRDSIPKSDVLQNVNVSLKIAKSEESVATTDLAVEIENSDKSVTANVLADENQYEAPFVFKCRPMEELIARNTAPIPGTDSESTDTSVHSESLEDDVSIEKSTSENIGNVR